jgi:hypothetical protein
MGTSEMVPGWTWVVWNSKPRGVVSCGWRLETVVCYFGGR